MQYDLRVLVPRIASGNGVMRNPTFSQFNELGNFLEYKLLKVIGGLLCMTLRLLDNLDHSFGSLCLVALYQPGQLVVGVTVIFHMHIVPRLSVPDFVSQLWIKIGRKAWNDFTHDTVAP